MAAVLQRKCQNAPQGYADDAGKIAALEPGGCAGKGREGNRLYDAICLLTEERKEKEDGNAEIQQSKNQITLTLLPLPGIFFRNGQ